MSQKILAGFFLLFGATQLSSAPGVDPDRFAESFFRGSGCRQFCGKPKRLPDIIASLWQINGRYGFGTQDTEYEAFLLDLIKILLVDAFNNSAKSYPSWTEENEYNGEFVVCYSTDAQNLNKLLEEIGTDGNPRDVSPDTQCARIFTLLGVFFKHFGMELYVDIKCENAGKTWMGTPIEFCAITGTDLQKNRCLYNFACTRATAIVQNPKWLSLAIRILARFENSSEVLEKFGVAIDDLANASGQQESLFDISQKIINNRENPDETINQIFPPTPNAQPEASAPPMKAPEQQNWQRYPSL
ncbi:hypothetical protein HOD08_03990 [bacterium]|nr:hypothetical protein [bacterium]